MLLIGIFTATIVLLLIGSSVNEARLGRCDARIEHQRNRRAIGSIIQKKLLQTGHHTHHLANATDEHELDVLRQKLDEEIDIISGALAVLAKGGVIEEKVPANMVDVDEIRKRIVYSQSNPNGIVIEVVELTPMIHDLIAGTDKLVQILRKRFSATREEEKNRLDKAAAFRLKAVCALVHRSRERANHIYYDTARRLAALETEREKTSKRMNTAKYIIIAASSLLVAIVGGLILMRVSQNLADRDRATAELKRSKQATQDILQKLPLGVIVIGRDKIIRYVNGTALSMAGYSSSEELVGKLCHATLCPAQADRCPILQLGQSLDNSERVLITSDKRKIPILKTVIPFELNGEQVLLESFIDISERKESEEMLRDYARALEETNHALEESNLAAREANKAKSEFLANMSHELRTPLHGILSFATFGRKKAKTADPDKLQNYFEKIDSSGETLLNLVNDLLDLSKLEAGKMILDPMQVDLFLLTHKVADEFSSRVDHQDITVKCEKRTSDTRITADHARLEQVIRNLLSNAIKFSPPGSTVKTRVESTDESILVSVLDQGLGIPENELEQIFDKFIQSSKTRTGAGGTGLGLSICREILDCHKGRIWAENRPQGGAVFRFEIPLDAAIPCE